MASYSEQAMTVCQQPEDLHFGREVKVGHDGTRVTDLCFEPEMGGQVLEQHHLLVLDVPNKLG
jgi:hypothetical protein